jgi:hypothetical protein
MDESEFTEGLQRRFNERQNEIMWKECTNKFNSRMYEPSISYISLCQKMRKTKKIDLLDCKGTVIRRWDIPFSTDLKVIKGRMYENDIDISNFFWDEMFWLYCYFNEKYGSIDFDRNDIAADFFWFGNEDDTDEDNWRFERDRPYEYIGEACSCKFIERWLEYEYYENEETVDDIWREDLQDVGQILPQMIWVHYPFGRGPIDELFESRYYSLIPLFVASLIEKYGKEESEGIIRRTLNYERCNGKTFWKEHLDNYRKSYMHNEQVTRDRLLQLLDCFDSHGLNILRKDDVKTQCLGTPDFDDTLGFTNFESVNMLVGRFGFDIMAYDGDIIDKGRPWAYERHPALISNVKTIYELIRNNVPRLVADRNQIPNQIPRKRKRNEE